VKILQIVSGQFVNGALVHVDLLTRELLKQGHEVQLLCRPRSWIWRRLHRTGIYKRKSELNRFPPGELLSVARWIRSEQFDVVHTHMSRAHFFGVLLRPLTGVPCVATAHTSHFQLHWQFNDKVIANSQSTYDYQLLYNRVAKNRLTTIPCFVDTEKFENTASDTRKWMRKELGLDDGQPVVGVVGAVTPRKGQLELVQALPQLIERWPTIKLIFIGQFERQSKYYKKIRQTLLHNRLFRRVVWVGRRNNVPELVQALDVCAVPSLKEPLGLCALEAMAAGIPVAAADVGGLREFVKPERTGLLFDPENPKDLCDAVSRLLAEQPLRTAVIQNGRAMLHQDFSPHVITSRIVDVYQSAIEGRQTQANPATWFGWSRRKTG
jgi:glycosyltransferase involved in cell wall biosynthesis